MDWAMCSSGHSPRNHSPVTGDCRDHAVPCRWCKRRTFALDAVCDRCHARSAYLSGEPISA